MENFLLEKIEPFAYAESSPPCAKAAYIIDRVTPNDFGVSLSKTFDDKTIMTPTTSMYEDASNIIIDIDLPGVNKNDISMQAKDFLVSVSGERKQPSRYRGHACKMNYQATMILPPYAVMEKLQANYKNGILQISMPIDKSKKSSKRVDIKE